MKYAVCVGINKYPSAPLNGCVNDARDWAHLLEDRDYTTRVLIDGTASKKTIMDSLRAAVSALRYRDTLVFTYSGHGSWVPDYSGDEPDHRDEVLCAYDYENGGLITDDEIYDVTSNRAFGTRVIILSDSCHSGSVHRFAGGVPQVQPVRAPSVYTGGSERVRFMPPDMFLSGSELVRAERAAEMPARGTSRRGSILISGCADDEYSYDAWISGRYNGAFTYNAIRAFEPQLSMKQWYNRIVPSRLPVSTYPQTPQLQGTWYQKTFWRM